MSHQLSWRSKRGLTVARMGWQLFPTGIGWREFSVTKEEGSFGCPNARCRGRATATQQYRLRRARNWFTVLFVPVLPLNGRGFYVECRHCKSIFSVDVLRDATGASVAAAPEATSMQPPIASAPAATGATADGAGAGDWHPDPFSRHRYRYWNGHRWTDQVANGGVVTTDPPEFPAPASLEAAWVADPAGRHRYRYWDGRSWTDQVANGGETSTDPVAPAPSASVDPPVPAVPDGPTTEPVDTSSTIPRGQLDRVHGPVVVLGDGTELDLSRPIVFGRDPIAAEGYADAALRRLDDQTVSKTHAMIGLEGDRVWVVDLDSRNGVTLASDPGALLTPGHRHLVDVGDTIVLGDSTTVRVLARPEA